MSIFTAGLNAIQYQTKKAKFVCDTLNRLSWKLKDNETWFIHDINDIDFEYTNAAFQCFTAGKTGIKIKNYMSVCPGGRW